MNIGLKGNGSTDDSPFALGGVGFYYNHSVNTGKWVCYSCNAGTLDTDNTTVAPVISTYTVFKIVIGAGTVSYYIDGVLAASSTTVPVADLII